jgi:tripartite-type tricarboxylate transporter receptor subunit TctC
MLKLIANIESFGEAGYVGSIDSIKGLVVEADTPQNTVKELLISLQAKFAYDNNVKMDEIELKQFDTEEELNKFVKEAKEGKNEINLMLC